MGEQMTVGKLMEYLSVMPKDITVLVEGNEADKVVIEECQGHKYVRIFKAWDVDFVEGYHE